MNPKARLAERIRTARLRLGLSQEDFALAAGFPVAQTVSDIERGKREVKAVELLKIARVLHLAPSDLLSESPPEAPVVLWREEPKGAATVEAAFVEKCRQYAFLVELTGMRRTKPLPVLSTDPLKLRYPDVADLAQVTANALNLGAKPATSLMKVLEEDHGVIVWCDNLGLDGSAACTIGEFGPAMLINAAEAPWRRNFSAAHELFHLLTWQRVSFDAFKSNPNTKARLEQLANSFAADLLLPADAVLAEFDRSVRDNKVRLRDLVVLAREFDISADALLWRLANLRRLSSKTVNKVLADVTFKALKSNLKSKWVMPACPPERFVRLAFLAYERGDLSRTRLAELLGVSLLDLPETLASYGLEEEQAIAAEELTTTM